MHREWVDRSAHSPGRLRSWDPRLKVSLAAATLVAISFGAAEPGRTSWTRLAALGAAVLLCALPSGVRLDRWLLRSLVVLPFVLTVALAKLVIVLPGSAEGIPFGGWTIAWAPGGGEEALRLLARAWISILATLLLAMATPFPAILAALGRARVPRGLLEACALVHRYLWLVLAEGKRMLLARRLRSGDAPPWRSGARIIAALFARSLARAHRVEIAMRLRGGDGSVPLARALAWTGADTRRAVIAGIILAVAVFLPSAMGAPPS